MDWVQLIGPAVVGALASIVVAWLTTRIRLRQERETFQEKLRIEREAMERKFRAETEQWQRDFALRFADAAARGPEHTRLIAQQFAGGYLQFRDDPHQTSAITKFIPVGVKVTIGRSEDCNFVLPDPERLVSRVHAMIDMGSNVAQLIDMSTGGTDVNGVRVGRGNAVPLKSGDLIRLGNFEVTFRYMKPGETGIPI